MGLAGRRNGRFSHGHAGAKLSPTYVVWASMLTRCTNPRSTSYPEYGGRGITVCERWRLFGNFLADMGERPTGRTLDRYPNRKGNYEPGNCRWATPRKQANNARHNIRVALYGETRTVAEWCASLGLRLFTIYSRISRGWAPESALTAPIQTKFRSGTLARVAARVGR